MGVSSVAKLALSSKMLASKQGSERSGPSRSRVKLSGLSEDTHPMVHGMLQASSFLKQLGIGVV